MVRAILGGRCSLLDILRAIMYRYVQRKEHILIQSVETACYVSRVGVLSFNRVSGSILLPRISVPSGLAHGSVKQCGARFRPIQQEQYSENESERAIEVLLILKSARRNTAH